MKLDNSRDSNGMEKCDAGDYVLVKFKSGTNGKCHVGIIDNDDDTEYEGRFMKRKEWDEFSEAVVFIYQDKGKCSFPKSDVAYWQKYQTQSLLVDLHVVISSFAFNLLSENSLLVEQTFDWNSQTTLYTNRTIYFCY